MVTKLSRESDVPSNKHENATLRRLQVADEYLQQLLERRHLGRLALKLNRHCVQRNIAHLHNVSTTSAVPPCYAKPLLSQKAGSATLIGLTLPWNMSTRSRTSRR